MEELGVSLRGDGVAPVGVPKVLPDGLGHRLGAAGLLALDQRQWDAVHEQHLVRDDELLALRSGDIEPELRHDHEVVALRVLPVDVRATRWSRPPSQPGSPSTVIPLSSRSVACWFASSRLGAPILVSALTA